MSHDIASEVQRLHTLLPQGVTLVAVSKFHPIEKLRRAYDAGQRVFGESRVQEMLTKIPEMPDDVRWHFCVESHPGLTDLFINQTREAWQKLGLFDASHCSEDNDYAGKLLILKPSVLKDEFKASDYQLIYAESGFGCSPTASGRKVFGKFLKDGENTSFNRSDFLGVIKDECIPEWAAEKLAELEPPDEDESEGITMGGM